MTLHKMTTIQDVEQWFINNSTYWYRDKFILNMSLGYKYSDAVVNEFKKPYGKNRFHQLLLIQSFPSTILTSKPDDAEMLTFRRNNLLIKEHDNPEIRERKKILLSTIWPTQEDPFFVEIIPSFDKQDGGYKVPVDWNFIGIVKYLWSRNIPTKFWHTEDDIGYIMLNFKHYYTIGEIENMPKEELKELRKAEIQCKRILCKEIKEFKPKIIGSGEYSKNAIMFDISDLRKIYKQIGYLLPKKSQAIKGNLIPIPQQMRVPLPK